jgi:hypothetical protein
MNNIRLMHLNIRINNASVKGKRCIMGISECRDVCIRSKGSSSQRQSQGFQECQAESVRARGALTTEGSTRRGLQDVESEIRTFYPPTGGATTSAGVVCLNR